VSSLAGSATLVSRRSSYGTATRRSSSVPPGPGRLVVALPRMHCTPPLWGKYGGGRLHEVMVNAHQHRSRSMAWLRLVVRI